LLACSVKHNSILLYTYGYLSHTDHRRYNRRILGDTIDKHNVSRSYSFAVMVSTFDKDKNETTQNKKNPDIAIHHDKIEKKLYVRIHCINDKNNRRFH